MPPATKTIRLFLAAIATVVLGGLAITLLQLTDTALSIQDRLAALPIWLAWPLGALLISLGGVLIWVLWQILRPIKVKVSPSPSLTRDAVLARAQALRTGNLKVTDHSPELLPIADLSAQVIEEIAELDVRAKDSTLYVAVFGEISTGKSSLIQALSGTNLNIGAAGGTTREVLLARARVPGRAAIMLADVPGTNECDGARRAVIAREEALRAHVVALVVTGDLSRAQAQEWQWLAAFNKPMWLILNKSDQYSAAELAQLLEKLKLKFGAEVIPTSAVHAETVSLIDVHGVVTLQTRQRAATLERLMEKLSALANSDKQQIEPARAKAVFAGLDLKLSGAEHTQRLKTGQQIIQQYTKRAMLGAMASVAPGSDLVIQGVLSFGMIQALCELYGIRMTQLEVDDLLKLIGGRLKSSIALILAIAGNAAKAFPGLGTLGGGALHAIAYGMLFERVGKSLLECLDKQLLDSRGGVDRLALLEKLDQTFQNHPQLISQAKALAKTMLSASVHRPNS